MCMQLTQDWARLVTLLSSYPEIKEENETFDAQIALLGVSGIRRCRDKDNASEVLVRMTLSVVQFMLDTI